MEVVKQIEENLLEIQKNMENNLSVVVEKQDGLNTKMVENELKLSTRMKLKNEIKASIAINDPMFKVLEVARLVGVHGDKFVDYIPKEYGEVKGAEYILVQKRPLENKHKTENAHDLTFVYHPTLPTGKPLLEAFDGDTENGTLKALNVIFGVHLVEATYSPDYSIVLSTYEWPPNSGTEKNVVACYVTVGDEIYGIACGINDIDYS